MEVSELSLEEDVDEIAEPYDISVDSANIFSGVTPKNSESLLKHEQICC